jgi:hypothetical protein
MINSPASNIWLFLCCALDGLGQLAAVGSSASAQYSFSNLTSGRSRRRSAAEGNDMGSTASGMGVAALEALRQTKLGALLGDTAAEMMQGEYSFSTSGFMASISSLSTNLSRK